MAVLVVNDSVLKPHARSWMTGKLSDFAGVALVPLALVSILELVRFARRVRRWQTTTREVAALCAVAAIALIAVKLSTPAANVYSALVGRVRWIARVGWSMLAGSNTEPYSPIQVVHDPSDLLALSALAVPIRVAKRATAEQSA